MLHFFSFAVSGYYLSKPKILRRLLIEWALFCVCIFVFKKCCATFNAVVLKCRFVFVLYLAFLRLTWPFSLMTTWQHRTWAESIWLFQRWEQWKSENLAHWSQSTNTKAASQFNFQGKLTPVRCDCWREAETFYRGRRTASRNQRNATTGVEGS